MTVSSFVKSFKNIDSLKKKKKKKEKIYKFITNVVV